jgi:hypothetical protein
MNITVKKDIKREVTKLFKKWFVKRPNGNCQVLFALTELDDFVDEIHKVYEPPVIDYVKWKCSYTKGHVPTLYANEYLEELEEIKIYLSQQREKGEWGEKNN